jgi:hypothetical protein
MHFDVVLEVQLSVTGGSCLQSAVFGSHAATPPEHAVLVELWHTMPSAQSVSAVQGPSSQT